MNLSQFVPHTPFDIKLRLLGFPMRVHWTFWLVMFLYCSRLGDAYFISAAVLLIMTSIWVHEMGHALAARSSGQAVDEIILYALGGLCVYSGGWLQPRKDIWISLAGPMAGFALGAVFGVLLFSFKNQVSDLAFFTLYYGFWMNIFINAINLVPVFPLDGGRVLRAYSQWKWDKSDLFVFRVSFVVALLAMGVSLACMLLLKWQSYGVFLFLILAVSNGFTIYQMNKMGTSSLSMGGDEEAPRQPWEQDPDWWKKG